jgi:hypothetical protein
MRLVSSSMLALALVAHAGTALAESGPFPFDAPHDVGPHDAFVEVMDAPPFDAGPIPDTGTSALDAGSDAAETMDAPPIAPGMDAGPPSGGGASGCSVRRGSERGGGVVLVVGVGLWLVVGRRRARR